MIYIMLLQSIQGRRVLRQFATRIPMYLMYPEMSLWLNSIELSCFCQRTDQLRCAMENAALSIYPSKLSHLLACQTFKYRATYSEVYITGWIWEGQASIRSQYHLFYGPFCCSRAYYSRAQTIGTFPRFFADPLPLTRGPLWPWQDAWRSGGITSKDWTPRLSVLTAWGLQLFSKSFLPDFKLNIDVKLHCW